jgi:hypothetical protein
MLYSTRLFATLVLVLLSTALFAQKKKGNQITLPMVKVVDTPVVEWASYPKDTTVVGVNMQTFSCVIKSRLPLKKVEIFTNGVSSDVYNQSDFKPAVSENYYEQQIERTVSLRTGSNILSVRVTNDQNIVQQSVRRIIVDPSQISTLRNEKDKTPPMIYVSSPANLREDYARVYEDLITVSGTVIDESGVQFLKINGTVTPVKANGAFIIKLPVNVGENGITIEAKDLNQNISLKKFVIDRKNMDGFEFKPEEAINYLIVIGVNAYSSWPKLYNAVSDAQLLKEVLTSQYKFKPEYTTVLLDSMATRANIYDVLRSHIERVTPHDNLMIYYSGHGHFDKLMSEGYWVPVDGTVGDVSGYIPNTQILKIIENINSQHTLLVADACFSGSLFASTSRGYSEQVEKYRSRWGLASGRLETVSDGELGKNSPFARSFIDYLKNNQEPKVPITDVIQYVKKKVAEVSDQAPVGNPLKGVGDEGGEFIFHKL